MNTVNNNTDKTISKKEVMLTSKQTKLYELEKAIQPILKAHKELSKEFYAITKRLGMKENFIDWL